MGDFTIGRAWSLGIQFIRKSPSGHAILLILMASVAPALIQFALVGKAGSLMNPAAFQDGGGVAALVGGSLAMVAALIAVYVLTTGGYFASWRLGLGRDADLGRSAGYGLVAGLAVVGVFFAIGLIGFALIQVLGWVGGLLLALIILPLFIAFYSVLFGMTGIAMVLMGLFMLLFGAAAGTMNSEMGAMSAGFAGVGAIIMVPLGLLFLWLAARFSCATPAMSSRGSLNFLEAVRESWHVTAPRQGRIMLYLALVGLLFGLVYLIFAGILAAAVGVSLASGGAPSFGIGTILITVAMGVLMAYVSVLVPAGIYRAAQPDVDASAAVFE